MAGEKRGESSKRATMTKKPQKGAPAAAVKPAMSEEERAGLLAKAACSASLNASAVMESFQKNILGPGAQSHHLRDVVGDRVQEVWAGDLQAVEAMLMAQAMALQTMFTSLTRRAAVQDNLAQYQTHMALGLKAQAQSRATLQALIEMKQPRHAPTFIKQANVAHGHQQVNNGAADPAPAARAEETGRTQNKLLASDAAPSFEYVKKGVNDEWLEQRAPRAAG